MSSAVDESKYRELEARLWNFYGATPREQMVSLAGFRTSVRIQEVGAGTPVLFLHGGPNSGSTWAPLVAGLKNFRCLILDRPGTGLSEPVRLDVANLPGFADGLVASVLDALAIERAHVVASSFGGYIALRSAAHNPARVDRMVQFGCPAFVPGMLMPPFMRLTSIRAVRRLMAMMPPTSAIAKNILQQIGHGASIRAGLIPGVFIDWYVGLQRFTDTMRNDGDMIGRLASVRSFDRSLTPSDETLGAVAAPTLFIWGEDDSFGSRPVAESLIALLPNAELVMYPRSGHLPWLDAPDRAISETAEFLGRSHLEEVAESAVKEQST